MFLHQERPHARSWPDLGRSSCMEQEDAAVCTKVEKTLEYRLKALIKQQLSIAQMTTARPATHLHFARGRSSAKLGSCSDTSFLRSVPKQHNA